MIGTDDKTDLALLKVDDPGPQVHLRQVCRRKPRVGDWVVAVGNPFGLGGTVTAGIVSAEAARSAGPYDDYIQIDAPVNRGNSGGPTFNVNGEVIGVNTAIYSPSGGSVGIAFDIPASTVASVVNDLMKHGSVVRGWLGVQIQTVDQGIADSLGLKQAEGAIVGEVDRRQPGAPRPASRSATPSPRSTASRSRTRAISPAHLADGSGQQGQASTYWRNGASHDVDVTSSARCPTPSRWPRPARRQRSGKVAALGAQGLRPDAEPRPQDQAAAS